MCREFDDDNDLIYNHNTQFLNEPGVDAGGLEREWFILVTQVCR